VQVALVQLPVQADAAARWREFHGPDDAEPIMPFPTAQRGRTAPPSPTPATGRLEHKATFI